MFAAARLALADLFSPPFRAALWKSLGLTIAVLIGLWFALSALFEWIALPAVSLYIPDLPNWVDQIGTVAGWAAGFVLAVLLAFLIAPVSAVIAGLFLDDVAEVVEEKHYPDQPTGRAMPLLPGIVLSLKFFGVVILGNIVALFLLLIPGINIVAFFLVNGYLLGREYFEFAAMRYRPETEAKALRSKHSGRIFLAGLLVAAFLAVPLLNLLTPLFAAAMMVHLHQRISAKESGLSPLASQPAEPLPRSPAPARSAREAPARRSS